MAIQGTPEVDKFFGDTSMDMSMPVGDDSDSDQGTTAQPEKGEASAAQQEGETTVKSEESSANQNKTEESQDFQTLFQDAESKRARQQSRADTEAFKNTKLTNRIGELEAQIQQQQQTANEDNDDLGLDGMDNDEYLTVKDVKRLLKRGPAQKQTVVTPEQAGRTSRVDQNAFAEWVKLQPDVQLVNTYYNANKADVDAYLDALGTDEMGQYQALRSLATQDTVAKLQQEVQVLKAPKRKKAVPIAGPGSGTSGGNVPSGPKGEDGYDRFFDQSWNRG